MPPRYNAEKTLRQTYEELPHEYVDEVILVDDASRDETSRVAQELGITDDYPYREQGVWRKPEDMLW